MILYSSVCGNSSINIKKYILPMLLTEDYFDNIEIKDEDINPNDLKDGFQYNEDDFKSLNEYNKS